MHREYSVVSQSYLAGRRTEDHMERDGLAMTFSSMHRPLSRYLSEFFAPGAPMNGGQARRRAACAKCVENADRAPIR